MRTQLFFKEIIIIHHHHSVIVGFDDMEYLFYKVLLWKFTSFFLENEEQIVCLISQDCLMKTSSKFIDSKGNYLSFRIMPDQLCCASG